MQSLVLVVGCVLLAAGDRQGIVLVVQEVSRLRVLIRNRSNKSRNRKVCVCVENESRAERAFQLIFPIVTGVHLVIHCSWVVAAAAANSAAAAGAAASMSPNNFTIFALQARVPRKDVTRAQLAKFNLQFSQHGNVQNKPTPMDTVSVPTHWVSTLNLFFHCLWLCASWITFTIDRSIKGAMEGYKLR